MFQFLIHFLVQFIRQSSRDNNNTYLISCCDDQHMKTLRMEPGTWLVLYVSCYYDFSIRLLQVRSNNWRFSLSFFFIHSFLPSSSLPPPWACECVNGLHSQHLSEDKVDVIRTYSIVSSCGAKSGMVNPIASRNCLWLCKSLILLM